MLKRKTYLITTVFILFVFFATAQEKARTKIDFDKDWKFKLDSTQQYHEQNINDANWRTLNLPHDWSIEGTFSKDNPATPGGGALPGGIGWYRKTFTIPSTEKNKIVLIDFDGVYRNSEVWINGHSLGVRPNGYISFQYDLTPYLNYGNQPNIIAVKVDNSKQPNSRWYSGSGIYRNVWLVTTNKIHVDHWGTFITTPTVSDKETTVNVLTKVANVAGSAEPITITTTLYDASGKAVAQSSITLGAADKESKAQQTLKVSNPKLWSIDEPYLYKAVSQIKSGTQILDTYETPFGIRYFNFDINKGFSLNGKPVKILGVCDHHDLGALGSAINTRALQRQLEILKAMGCNGIRTSHNPPAPELLNLCDKMGFIVMDEAFDMWAKQKTRYDYHLYWKEWHKKDLEDQIMRDRNHPSVFIWSIGNEIPEQWDDPSKDTLARVIARELVNIVKALDTTRAITTANNEVSTRNNIIQSGAFDLIGYNYNHQIWDKFHERWPGKKMIVTESTSALETRGYYDLVPFDTIRRWPKRWDLPFTNPNGGYTVSAYDNVSAPWGSTHEESIKALLKSKHVSGMYIWTGFDYLGEPTPYSWPARSSYFGIVDLAGFPKDVYYLYQSIFTNKPVLHIYPHWNWKQGDTVDVVSYYNKADEVELFLNGKLLGIRKKSGDDLHVMWRVKYEPGVIKAISRKDGKVVLTKEIKTAGKPAKIILTADRNNIKADGNDLSFITAKVVDAKGNVVPDADNLIEFTAKGEGEVIATDNGLQTSLEPFKSNKHKAFNGLCLAVVQSKEKAGTVVVTASAQGLQSTSVIIATKK
jgi:beta-galactosidase